MMRAMYSGVSGLKTHQTKMDVIGNNIANVNTVGFKSSNVTFSDIMYQRTSAASGATATKGGVNAKQIGLGVTTGATSVNITSQGAAQNTGGAFDIRISDSGASTSFFVVNNGSQNVFTRSGSFYIDGAGNLAMTSTGYQVMGWQPDPDTGLIKKDIVSPLQIMKEENLTSAPEATTYATVAGVLDGKDTDASSKTGYAMSLQFYDDLGESYTAKFATRATGVNGEYTVELSDIIDANGASIFKNRTDGLTASSAQLFGKDYTTNAKTYTCNLKNAWSVESNKAIAAGDTTADPSQIAFTGSIFTDGTDTYAYDGTSKFYRVNVTTTTDANGVTTTTYKNAGVAPGSISLATFFDVPTDVKDADGNSTVTYQFNAATAGPPATPATCTATKKGVFYEMTFNTGNGKFTSIGDSDGSVDLKLSALGTNFKDISIDFSSIKMYGNGGTSTMGMSSGQADGTTGKGKKMGNMIGLSVSDNGEIYGTYDNGNKQLLGQIAVAQFANASGLEKAGENCYTTTLNSGEFDGIGVDITASGGKLAAGELEMSNVDLAQEFTEMITTQRGFQANSRIITTSDSLLEELVNLKR